VVQKWVRPKNGVLVLTPHQQELWSINAGWVVDGGKTPFLGGSDFVENDFKSSEVRN